MTFASMKTELSDRGFAHLSDTRLGVYINNARAELDRMFFWPWREASATGTAPLTIADLGVVEAVVDSNTDLPLRKADYRSLLESFGDLSIVGTPSFYYIAWPSGSPVVATYPDTSGSIGVQYWKVTADLTGVQTPASPAEAHYTIVDLAVRRAYRDSDNHAASEALQSEIDRAIGELLVQYPPGIADGPDAYVGYSGSSVDD